MGLWYRIASVSFVGGSLVEVGGHNPFEPALLGSAILFGPHVRNFVDGYRRLSDAGAAVLVRSEPELAEALVATIAPDRAAEMAAAAWAACSEGAEVTDAVLDADRHAPRRQDLRHAPAGLLGQPAVPAGVAGAAAGAPGLGLDAGHPAAAGAGRRRCGWGFRSSASAT